MSYILDALKKSDQQRQQQSAPGIHSRPRHGETKRTRVLPVWIPVLGLLVMINLILWPDVDMPKEVSPTGIIDQQPSHSQPDDFTTPPQTLGDNVQPILDTGLASSETVTQTSVDSAALKSRDPFTPLINMPPTQRKTTPAVYREGDTAKAVSAVIRPNLPTPDLLKLQQTLVRQQIMNSLPTKAAHPVQPARVAKTAPVPASISATPIAEVKSESAPVQTALLKPSFDAWEQAAGKSSLPNQQEKPAPSLPISEQAGPIPNRLELADEIQQDIPEIKVSVHIFAHEPQQRRARINGRMHYQGDQLAKDLTLEEITPQALIFSYKDNLFRVSP